MSYKWGKEIGKVRVGEKGRVWRKLCACLSMYNLKYIYKCHTVPAYFTYIYPISHRFVKCKLNVKIINTLKIGLIHQKTF